MFAELQSSSGGSGKGSGWCLVWQCLGGGGKEYKKVVTVQFCFPRYVCVKGEPLGLIGHEWCQSQSAVVSVVSPCPRTLRLQPSKYPVWLQMWVELLAIFKLSLPVGVW